MTRTDRLRKCGHARQLAAVARTERCVLYADSVVQRLWRQVLACLKLPCHEAHGRCLLLLRALPLVARQVIADRLTAQVRWAHRTTRAALRRELRGKFRHALAYPPVGVSAPIHESFDWADLFAPLRSFHEPAADVSPANIDHLLFAAPSPQRVNQIVYASGWQDRLKSGTGLAAPEALAARIATGMMLGHSHHAIARDVLPAVQRVQASARRIARTESMRVSAAVQMDAHEQLGDLVVGYQINATLDERTRPEHRSRDGTVYYREPGPGQKGMDEMPRPPMEADGTPAWNCRCYLTPVLRG